ncbi:multidrug effflux MFS transporter [Polynucleobacter sp. AP-Kolm-20A-A1]|uniref:multidrug effflux MFS transporter n=1 Tax=Polynucleobacter sp. AP-Kolm-20A-A1 TaxID=2081041 RepID=UPI001BFD9B27|nr:multidrug effflux MFS transporter [Polynucleobacter sp. AP-Kolm-20A-A1]
MPHKEIFLIPILMALVILPMIATDIYLPAMSDMGLQLSAASADVTNTLTSYMLGYSLSLLLAGILADIYGRRFICIAGLLVFCVSSIGCYFVSTIEQLITLRFFQALGGGCGTLLARVIVRDLYDQKSQVRVLSFLAAGMVISPIFGPSLGAYIASYFDWRTIFFVLAIFSFLVLIFLYIFLSESLTNHENQGPFCFGDVISQYSYLLRHREFMFYTLVISFAWMVYFAFLSSSPVLIRDFYQASAVEYGYIFSATVSGFILGTFFIRWKMATINLRNLVFLAAVVIFIATLIGYILITLQIKSLQVRLIFVFFALFGIGIIFPAAQAGVTRPFKNNIGLISGFFYSIEMFFGAICGYVLSMIGNVTWISTSTIMLIAAICIVLLCIFDKWYELSRGLIRFNPLVK